MRDGEITGDPLGEGEPLTGDIVKALATDPEARVLIAAAAVISSRLPPASSLN